MSLTTDPKDPRLGHGIDNKPSSQRETYLVLSEEERAKGFVRQYRDTYRHVGPRGPTNLRDLTPDEHERYDKYAYVKYEAYSESQSPVTGRFWTQKDLNALGSGCNIVTKMDRTISETYARDPKFYGSTYCIYCKMHRPVEEFVWEGTDIRVGE